MSYSEGNVYFQYVSWAGTCHGTLEIVSEEVYDKDKTESFQIIYKGSPECNMAFWNMTICSNNLHWSYQQNTNSEHFNELYLATNLTSLVNFERVS